MRFEIHVTVPRSAEEPEGWKVTLPKLERDDVDSLHLTGDKILTRWTDDYENAIELAFEPINAIRRKIEEVRFDKRYNRMAVVGSEEDRMLRLRGYKIAARGTINLATSEVQMEYLEPVDPDRTKRAIDPPHP